ncbi:MAG: DNA-3-methyladenine glycosylase, partial [Chloroflexota bacterium]
PQPEQRWTDGPGKLTQALGIDNQYNGIDLVSDDAKIFIEDGEPILDDNVTSSPRVGLYSVPEPWKSIPWRFQAAQAAIEDYNLTEEIKTTGGTYEFA